MTKVDEGHAALTSISRTYGQLSLFDANEAETRLKVIDEMIFNVLGGVAPSPVEIRRRLVDDYATFSASFFTSPSC